jgi:hypothetical protein
MGWTGVSLCCSVLVSLAWGRTSYLERWWIGHGVGSLNFKSRLRPGSLGHTSHG